MPCQRVLSAQNTRMVPLVFLQAALPPLHAADAVNGVAAAGAALDAGHVFLGAVFHEKMPLRTMASVQATLRAAAAADDVQAAEAALDAEQCMASFDGLPVSLQAAQPALHAAAAADGIGSVAAAGDAESHSLRRLLSSHQCRFFFCFCRQRSLHYMQPPRRTMSAQQMQHLRPVLMWMRGTARGPHRCTGRPTEGHYRSVCIFQLHSDSSR